MRPLSLPPSLCAHDFCTYLAMYLSLYIGCSLRIAVHSNMLLGTATEQLHAANTYLLNHDLLATTHARKRLKLKIFRNGDLSPDCPR